MPFHEPIPSGPSIPDSSLEKLTAADRMRAAMGIQRRLAEEWMDRLDTEIALSPEQRDGMAMEWLKKYSAVFRAEFDECADEHMMNWKQGPGWVWLSNLQTRLDQRLREMGRKRMN